MFLDMTLDGDTKPSVDLVDLFVTSQSGKTAAPSGHINCVTIRAAIDHCATSFIEKDQDNATMLKAVDAILCGLELVPTKAPRSASELSK